MKPLALLILCGCSFVHHHPRATAVTATTTIITGLAVLTPLTDCTQQPGDHCSAQTLEAGGIGLAASAFIGAITIAEMPGGEVPPPILAHAAVVEDVGGTPDEPAARQVQRTGDGDAVDQASACVDARRAVFARLREACDGRVAATDLASTACTCVPDPLIGEIACSERADATCGTGASLVLGAAAGTRADASTIAAEEARGACGLAAADAVPATCTCDASGRCECVVVTSCATSR